ncbi:MAG: HAD-IIIC family phosphatase [Ruminococcaceae bacterium]|nr:HAD-IIIC family phosphatase [Oscillospiraceae bacterium]
MYQFYYADKSKDIPCGEFKKNISDVFKITAVRPAMWEEHCLECSAPLCFESCLHYAPRSDGRCKRFDNGMWVFENPLGCCGEGVHIKFRKWANMMTVLFPAMLSAEDYEKLTRKNKKMGNMLGTLEQSKLPRAVRWQGIRIPEFLRRRKLRGLQGLENTPDAFLFHGYSHNEESFNLILEIYNDHTSVYKTSIRINHGENMAVIPAKDLSAECSKNDNLVKIYPENDIEAEMDILWCDFVKGTPVVSEKPADKIKCIVWDLDNTLWDGTLIETENPETLALKPHVLDTIVELDKRGIIQSVASKNDYENAFPVLERLGVAEYFIYPQIHWNAKSGSISNIAKLLNIGVDSFGFIDDTVFEREEVRSALPQVRVYDALELNGLLSRNEFSVPVTEESKNRRAMYRAEEKRNQLMNTEFSDSTEFLRKCNLKINIFNPETQADVLRCYELVVRTNQLNMSGVKYTEEEFKSVLNRENHTNFAFSCADDFGSYGIVGFGQYYKENGVLKFTEFAMSCRVAGKYAESALFASLLSKEDCEKGVFPCVKTKKNILLRNTLADIGFVITEDTTDKSVYEFSKELKNNDIVKTL